MPELWEIIDEKAALWRAIGRGAGPMTVADQYADLLEQEAVLLGKPAQPPPDPEPEPEPEPQPEPTTILHGVYPSADTLAGQDMDFGKFNCNNDNWDRWHASIRSLPSGVAMVQMNFTPWPKRDPGGGSVARWANGDFDAHYRQAAADLKGKSIGLFVGCIAHEANDSVTQPWAMADHVAQFGIGWNRTDKILADVLGAKYQGCWVLLYAGNLNDLAAWCPSRAQRIGVDVYDNHPGRKTNPGLSPQQAWSSRQGPALAKVAAFAQSRGLPIDSPEWGLVGKTASQPQGGGDNPYFVRQFGAWCDEEGVQTDAYHNSQHEGRIHYLDRFPNAQAAYVDWVESTRT